MIHLHIPLASYIYLSAYLTGILSFLLMAHHRRQLSAELLEILVVAIITGISGSFITQWIFGSNAGKTVIGGIASGYAAVALYKRKNRILQPTGDLFAIAISIGEAIGRWGCYYAGCCYGKVCNYGWVIYQHNAFRYPTQIYMSIASIIIFACLLCIECFHPRVNTLFYIQGLNYCIFRFVIEFYREGPRIYDIITIAQVVCILGIAYFSMMIFKLYKDLLSGGFLCKMKTVQ